MFGGYFTSWNRFKVFVKDGFEPHFKVAIRSFDPNAQIKDMVSYFLVETKIDREEIAGFTSVRNVVKITFLDGEETNASSERI